MASIIVEGFVWFSVAAAVTVVRITTRIKDLGDVRRLQLDDYLILIALCFFAAQIGISIDAALMIEKITGPLVVEQDGKITLRMTMALQRLLIAFDQCKIGTVWLVKGCLLTLDYRITIRIRPQNLAIKIITGYVIVSFFILEIFYFFVWCRPFSNRWNNPAGQCGVPIDHCIMEAVFNISSDVAMIVVMVPMLARSGLPWRQKCFVCGLFALGGFVIFCAAASKYYTFTDPTGKMWINYFIREPGTAIIVANLSMMGTCIRKASSTVGRYSSRGMSIASTVMSLKRRRSTKPDLGTSDFATTNELSDTPAAKQIIVRTTIETTITEASAECEQCAYEVHCDSWNPLHAPVFDAPWSVREVDEHGGDATTSRRDSRKTSNVSLTRSRDECSSECSPSDPRPIEELTDGIGSHRAHR